MFFSVYLEYYLQYILIFTYLSVPYEPNRQSKFMLNSETMTGKCYIYCNYTVCFKSQLPIG